MRKLVFAVALGATMVASQAFAKDHGGQRGAWMQDMTRAQAQQMADAMFQRFDANHDGVVTRQEAEQAASQFGAGGRAQKMLDRAFGQAQSLTLQQFETQSLARFDRDDLNHDGTVTAAERQQARAALKAERAGQPQQCRRLRPVSKPGAGRRRASSGAWRQGGGPRPCPRATG